MKAWIVLVLVTAAALPALAPTASAHSCNGMDCGPCVKGEDHQHNDAKGGQCSSGPGYIAENGYGGQRFSPNGGLLAAVGGLGLAALALRRRGPRA